MARISDDLTGVVTAHVLGDDGWATATVTLRAGDTVPAGVNVGGHVLAPDPVPLEQPGPRPAAPASGAPFDPAQHPWQAVVEHLKHSDPAERARVLAAERAGKDRTRITGSRYAREAS